MSDSKQIYENAVGLLQNVGEVGIDAFLENGVLKDIPLLGSIVGVFKLSKSISDGLLLAKVKRFTENLGSISQEEKDRFNESLEDKETFSRASRMVLHYLNNCDSEQKAEMLGYIFGRRIAGDLSESTFKKFSSLIGRMNTNDLRDFVSRDGDFDWLYAHDYIANGIAIFQVPKVETLDDIGFKDGVDQTGMTYGVNPWGAEVIRVLKPYFDAKPIS